MSGQAHRGRIFGIGLSRTGTLSLAVALRLLGYRTVHYPWSLEEIHAHDAATDIPVTRRFAFLQEAYPGAKFVLTTRDTESWLASCERHFTEEAWRDAPPLEWTDSQRYVAETEFALYGTWRFDAEQFAEAKERHEAAVRTAFRASPERRLVIDIANRPDIAWPELLAFLGYDEIPFPWEHRSPADGA